MVSVSERAAKVDHPYTNKMTEVLKRYQTERYCGYEGICCCDHQNVLVVLRKWTVCEYSGSPKETRNALRQKLVSMSPRVGWFPSSLTTIL